MLKKALVGLLSVLLIGFVIYGCGKVVEETQQQGAGTGSLIGRVQDINGDNLAGVTVSVTGTTTTGATNANGYFSILSVPAVNRAIVNFSKSGYVSTSRIVVISEGVAGYVETNMAQASAVTVLDAGSGGTATDPNNADATVTITGGTLRDSSGNVVTGNVDVGVTAFDPTVANQRAAFPGNFAGVVDGQEQPFKSFGFMDATVTQDGEDLSIGSTAQIEIPIPASQASSAPDTMDAWYFDTDQGKWIQDGTLTKVATNGGYVYRKNVSHFSTWNADYLYQEAYKSGKVVDEEGNPVEGATVVAEGDGWRNETTTDSNGEYTLAVEPNSPITEYARMGTQVSSTVDETTPATGETIDVSDLVLAAPLVTITLIWGENPSDLDSHLTGPTPEAQSSRFHCYFSNKNPTGSHTSLDIDYTVGYGPEHTTVSRLREGIYRFAVHHFSGSSTIQSSEAQVRLDIPSKGIIGELFTPPTGQLSTHEVWRVFDLIVNASGNVSVQTLGDYADENNPKDAYLTSYGIVSGAGLPKKKK